MTTETTPMTRRSSQQRLASLLLVAAVLSACAGTDSATTRPGSDPVRSEVTPVASDAVLGTSEEPRSDAVTAEDSSPTEPGDVAVETRREIGPRAVDIEQEMMMVVDSIDVSGDDIFVRLRVVNGSDAFLNISVQNTRYGPLLVMRDDRDNMYPARATEPAGIDSYSVGTVRFRLDGPFDPDAEEFTLELATNRGPLTTDPVPAPDGGEVRWWSESPPVTFSELAVTDQDDRTVRVVDVVDRGTHLAISVEARDPSSEFSSLDDVRATLSLADGTQLTSLHQDGTKIQQSDAITGVLGFLTMLPTDSEALTLNMAGIDVEIPATQPSPTETAIEPPFAGLPRLPDLLDRRLTTEPLPITRWRRGS